MNPSKLTKFMVIAALFEAFASMKAAEQPKRSLVAERAAMFQNEGASKPAPAKQAPAKLQTIKTVNVSSAVSGAAANYGRTHQKAVVTVPAPAASPAQAQASVSDEQTGFSKLEKTGYNPAARASVASKRSRPTKKQFKSVASAQSQMPVNAMTVVSAPAHEGLDLQKVKLISGDTITIGTPKKQQVQRAPVSAQAMPEVAVQNSNPFMEQLMRMAVCGGMSFVSSLTDKNWVKGVSELGQLAVVAHAAHQHKTAMSKQDSGNLLKKTLATAFLCQFAAQALSTQKGSLMSTDGLKKLVAYGLTKGALAWFTQIPSAQRWKICEGILKQDMRFF